MAKAIQKASVIEKRRGETKLYPSSNTNKRKKCNIWKQRESRSNPHSSINHLVSSIANQLKPKHYGEVQGIFNDPNSIFNNQYTNSIITQLLHISQENNLLIPLVNENEPHWNVIELLQRSVKKSLDDKGFSFRFNQFNDRNKIQQKLCVYAELHSSEQCNHAPLIFMKRLKQCNIDLYKIACQLLYCFIDKSISLWEPCYDVLDNMQNRIDEAKNDIILEDEKEGYDKLVNTLKEYTEGFPNELKNDIYNERSIKNKATFIAKVKKIKANDAFQKQLKIWIVKSSEIIDYNNYVVWNYQFNPEDPENEHEQPCTFQMLNLFIYDSLDEVSEDISSWLDDIGNNAGLLNPTISFKAGKLPDISKHQRFINIIENSLSELSRIYTENKHQNNYYG